MESMFIARELLFHLRADTQLFSCKREIADRKFLTTYEKKAYFTQRCIRFFFYE